ncbi:MAG: hypothetical protein RL226_492 [Bacteroidota bacterium]|jgi:BirA family biotin operon repressor/biotin-[acetyl-CoA-carboxylase] ligase
METIFVGQSVIRLQTVDSTNKYAANHLNLPEWTEGTVILADEQTAGRGRNNNRWESEPGSNLLMSVVFRPTFIIPQELFTLSMGVALAVADTLRFFNLPDVSIKWPNDVLSGEQKLAGILIENQLRGNRAHTAIVGIGLNVNQLHGFPDRGSSIARICGRNTDKEEVFNHLCLRLERRYLELRSDVGKMVNAYNEQLFALGTYRAYQFDRIEHAVLKEVKPTGQAVFNTQQGVSMHDMNSVKWLW